MFRNINEVELILQFREEAIGRRMKGKGRQTSWSKTDRK